MGMAAPIYYTADMVRAMPDDGNRYEVVYGELLVTPSPRPWHQVIVQRLSLALGNYLEREPFGLVLSSPADISWGPDVLVQPDVFVVPVGEARTLTWSRMRTLLLVAEVLSPSSSRRRPVSQASPLPGGRRAALLGGGRRRAGRRGVDAGGRFPGRRARPAGVAAGRRRHALQPPAGGAVPAGLSPGPIVTSRGGVGTPSSVNRACRSRARSISS